MPDLTTSKTLTTTKTINRYEIKISNVILDTSARIELFLYNGDSFVDIRIIELTGEAYNAWGSQDSYITTYCENYIATYL